MTTNEQMARWMAHDETIQERIAQAKAVVREVEFHMDRAAREWRRAGIDLRTAHATLSAAHEAEARRHFEADLRDADLRAGEAHAEPTRGHGLADAPDAPAAVRGAGVRKMHKLV